MLPDSPRIPPTERDITIPCSVQEILTGRLWKQVPGRFDERIFGQAEIFFDGLGCAVVDVPPPAADLPQRSDQADLQDIISKRLAAKHESSQESQLARWLAPTYYSHMMDHPLRA